MLSKIFPFTSSLSRGSGASMPFSTPAFAATCSHCAGANENPRHKHSRNVCGARIFANRSISLLFFSSSYAFSSSISSSSKSTALSSSWYTPLSASSHASLVGIRNARNRSTGYLLFPSILKFFLLSTCDLNNVITINSLSHRTAFPLAYNSTTNFVSVSFAPNVNNTARSIPSCRISFNRFCFTCFRSFCTKFDGPPLCCSLLPFPSLLPLDVDGFAYLVTSSFTPGWTRRFTFLASLTSPPRIPPVLSSEDAAGLLNFKSNEFFSVPS
mmetsp:Transcript_8644/g.28345  ORF Transcript_8644/g.28345 Transcript_8644/m.28345 type:complete len:270 (-) Transcript_8644:244-1053(-)